jgi:hypothetical protein
MTRVVVVVAVPVGSVGISLPARMTLFGIYPQVHRYPVSLWDDPIKTL